MTSPPPRFHVLHPDGLRESRPWPTDVLARLKALQDAVGGRIEYVSVAFHALVHWDVVINEEGALTLAPNRFACERIGFDLARFRPLCGPVALVPRASPATAQRERERTFFERLERALEDGGPDDEWGTVIDARGGFAP